MQTLVDALVRCRLTAAARRHAQGRPAAAVDFALEIDDRAVVLAGRRQHGRTGAVAEEHARRAVPVVDDARHHVGPDDEDVVVRAGRDELAAGRQCERERRAGRAQVESPRVARADLVLYQARRTREEHVRRHRADHDDLDVVGRESGSLNRLDRRFLAEIGRCDTGIDDVALADAGALKDPLVARIDHLFEVGVGQQPRRHVRGERTQRHRAPAGAWRARPGRLPAARFAGRTGLSNYHSRASLRSVPGPFPGCSPSGMASPKYSYAWRVATRPRGVRSRKPIWIRNGS